MNPQTFVFIGRSGSGKGTQAKLLKEYLSKKNPERNQLSLETGALFREFIEGDSYSQELSRKINEAGELQPVFLVVNLWGSCFVSKMQKDIHIILDGTPRKAREVPILTSAFKFYEREKPTVLYIDVSRGWARERLTSRGRGDDNKEEIKSRLDWFETNVKGAIEKFKEDDYYTVLNINGEQTIEEVHKELIDKAFPD